MTRFGAVVLATLTFALPWAVPAAAQNDWQFPDPYFGAVEIEKSRAAGGSPREAVRPVQPRSPARPRLWRMTPRPAGRAGAAAGRPSAGR